MKLKDRLIITAAALMLSAVFCLPVSAGTWTNVSPNGWKTDSVFYIGDNGQYVKSRWVQDNGVWYWITADGTRASSYGISDDGYIYNEQGIWVPSAQSGSSYSKGGSVSATTQHSPAWSGSPNYYYYRPSDYGPGAGGISDPHDHYDWHHRW